MAALIYTVIASLDGYVADRSGNFDWAAPDDEVHAFVNHLERPVGTYLYGRRMYETMRFWETGGDAPEQSPATRDYAAIWRAADKIVYSTTLTGVTGTRTRLEHTFDPGAVRALKATSPRDLSIGGPHLAAAAIRAGLVDEYRLFLVPVLVGGGTHWLTEGARASLLLVDQQSFGNGAVYLHYRAAGGSS